LISAAAVTYSSLCDNRTRSKRVHS